MYYLESYAEGFDKEYTIKDFTTHEVLRLTKDETTKLLKSGVVIYRLGLDDSDEIIIEKRKGTIFSINTLEDYAILTDRTYLLDEYDTEKNRTQPYNLRKVSYRLTPIRYRLRTAKTEPASTLRLEYKQFPEKTIFIRLLTVLVRRPWVPVRFSYACL